MKAVSIGPEHHGGEFHLGVGERALLRLPENPTTGVRWSVERLTGDLSVVRDGYEQGADGVGAAGMRVLELLRTGPGPVELELLRWQPWEGRASIEARFSCRFTPVETGEAG